MKEVTFKNGHLLKIMPAPFAEAEALLEALSAEALKITIQGKPEIGEIAKNLVAVSLSSKPVKLALKKCLLRSTYDSGSGELKIDDDTWSTVEARENYIDACVEVTEENLRPFMKSLFALFVRLVGLIPEGPA